MRCSLLMFPFLALLLATVPADGLTRQAPKGIASAESEESMVYTGPLGTRGGTLVLPCVGMPLSYNPALTNETASSRIVECLNAALLGYDAVDQDIAEGLSSSYSATPDGLTWTFKLRKGIRWSDGQPFDAADVLFTFRVLFDPRIDNGNQAAFIQSDGSYPRVEKIDSHTVRFKLNEPNPIFLFNLSAAWLIPRHKLAKAYERGDFVQQLSLGAAPDEVVGLGPFRLREAVVADDEIGKLILERNPHYWKKDRSGNRLPYLDVVEFRIMPDQNTALAQFLGGSTDLFMLRPDDFDLVARAKAAGRFTIHDLGPGLQVTYLLFNRNDPTPSGTGQIDALAVAEREWFFSEKFRQAISYAVDRERIANRVYGGRAAPVYTLTSAGNRYWYDAAAVRQYSRDLRTSKQLLAEVGIEDRNGDGILEDTKGNRIEFTIRTNQNNPYRLAIVNQLIEDLAELGIVATAMPVPFNAMVDALQSTHDFDAVVGGWQTGNPPDPVLMKSIIMSSGILHYGRPSQSKPATKWEGRIDELMRLSERTLDLGARQRQYSEITRLWSENLPEIELVAQNHILAVRNRIGNFRPAVVGEGAWNVDELFIRAPMPKENRVPVTSSTNDDRP